MIYFIIKVLSSAIIIGIISEVSKKSNMVGSIFASVPLTSLLAIIWLYEESKDTVKIIDLSYNIFWLVIPSLSFFIVLPALLKTNLNFYLSTLIALVVMIILYFVMIFILGKFGYKI